MNSNGHLVVSSFDGAEEEIRNYEIKNTCSYTVFRRNEGFTQALSELDLSSYRLSWEYRKEGCNIEYSGVPFISLGYDVRECQFGPDRNKVNKVKHANKRGRESVNDHAYITKGRRLIQPTKKVGCPSRIWLKRILRFPNFKIHGNASEWKKKKLSKTFHKAPSLVNTCEEFHVFLPTVDSHAGHIMGQFASLAQPVDSRVKAKIADLMDEGVSKVSEMKRHIHIFSKNELLPSSDITASSISRRFHPTDKDVRNYMALHKQKSRFSSNDQENLKQMVIRWRDTFPDDNFFLRTSQEGQFLFVQQTQWQRRLLGLYGNDICLLDATYKTSKFNLPLFFVCVCTNVGYSVVGSFISSDEKKTSIMEGLSFIKVWSTEWQPSYFMTDYDYAEIGALEEIFSA